MDSWFPILSFNLCNFFHFIVLFLQVTIIIYFNLVGGSSFKLASVSLCPVPIIYWTFSQFVVVWFVFFWHRMFQAHLILSLSEPWTQAFQQSMLVLFCGNPIPPTSPFFPAQGPESPHQAAPAWDTLLSLLGQAQTSSARLPSHSNILLACSNRVLWKPIRSCHFSGSKP